MPEHVTVYCRRPLTKPLGQIVGEPDYLMAAERAGIDDAAMTSATRDLVVAANTITFGGSSRPIHVTHATEPALVQTLVQDVSARIDGDDHGALATLLRTVVQVVDLELGLEQAEGIGGLIAEQIALAIAFETDGIIDFYGNEWREV